MIVIVGCSRLVGWLVTSLSVARSVIGWLVCCSVGCLLVSWLSVGWLVGWLFVCWWVGWLSVGLGSGRLVVDGWKLAAVGW